MVDHGYEATVGAIHPGGTTVAIGGDVSRHFETLDHYWKISWHKTINISDTNV